VRIVVDADVPNSVAEFFQRRGHEVIFSREVLLPESKDPLVARLAADQGAVLVTWNRKDFLALAKRRRGPHGAYTYAGMHLITFDACSHPEGLQRLQALIEEIETAYERRVAQRHQRLVAIIGRTYIKYEDLA
jgi:predicted nuclease of predicted toxin-antitoxin system